MHVQDYPIPLTFDKAAIDLPQASVVTLKVSNPRGRVAGLLEALCNQAGRYAHPVQCLTPRKRILLLSLDAQGIEGKRTFSTALKR